jgi:hypothetical protein
LQSLAYFGCGIITCPPLAEGLTGTILKEREKLGAASIAESAGLAGLFKCDALLKLSWSWQT